MDFVGGKKRKKSMLIHWMGRSTCSLSTLYPREAISDEEGKEPVTQAGVLDSAANKNLCYS